MMSGLLCCQMWDDVLPRCQVWDGVWFNLASGVGWCLVYLGVRCGMMSELLWCQVWDGGLLWCLVHRASLSLILLSEKI